MALIGRQLGSLSDRVVLDNITVTTTDTFNLLLNGVAFVPNSAEALTVSLNGIIQKPQGSYTVSGSQIIFSSSLTSGTDVIDFIIAERAITLQTPSAGSVGLTQLASNISKISWDLTPKTSGFTATANTGYFCNTTSASFTVTLPASPTAGQQIQLVDYAGTFATNNITLVANGNKINGATSNKDLTTNREGVTITYVDSTQGWVASSGVNSGDQALDPTSYSVDFLVVAGGGGAGSDSGGGGGAGGYRNSYSSESSGGGGSSETELTFIGGTVYTITVGAGGSGGTETIRGTNGNNSSISGTGISTITSTGGGGGGSNTAPAQTGSSGGSGGGAGVSSGVGIIAGGAGTSNQGYAGGDANGGSYPNRKGGGGGGASAAGGNATTTVAGNGGNGLASSITASSVTRAGGGGGGGVAGSGTAGTGGTGGGGAGSTGGAGTSGTTNTGSGGGASDYSYAAGAGGSGVVILRMATANYTGTTTGSPTVSTSGSDTILIFNASGSYTG